MRLNGFIDLLFPPVCPLCEEAFSEREFCAACESALALTRIDGPACNVCGCPFISASSGPHTCGTCLKEPPPYLQAVSACRYEGKMRDAIHAFKFNAQVHLAAGLASIAETAARFNIRPQIIMPVPLHISRLRQRGFNQSLLIAAEIAGAHSIPLDYTSITRLRHTAPQSGLKAVDRHLNVKGAFAVTRPDLLKDRHVLLVDDVLTTGSTITECAATLKSAGAAVYVLTLARV
ncbi:MAG: hypothetical protein A3J24_01475 [Deltaproteobacteria bacterium RIFCSPLOWO2_02_FULL_53_8]|nr:MAG: hypothetical protein A3J24_01475 [Deltaproteobacteria bacterium RIFCSPLOWO2_02_FULL_53_8]